MKKNKNDLQNRKQKQQKLKFIKLRIISFFVIGLIISMSVSSSVLAAEPESFGGGTIPPSFTGENYRVYGASVNPQFSQPGFYAGGISPKTYWANFEKEDCRERQDVILQIPPGGCSPAVVRSDLLEEQNVPVFCKVASIQVNPLIDITKIRSIHFKGEYPPGISGISYYPARAAVRSSDKLVGSPIIDNVGYLVVVLRRTPAEKDMPDWIEANVTAVIDYDAEGVFGVGKHDFFLTEMDDEQWEREYKDYGFWKGKGFIRAEAIDEDSARISIYRDANRREASVSLKKGETSRDIYLGGYYCAAGMNIKLESVGYPTDTALLRVDDEELWVGKNSKFLNGRCSVKSIEVGDVGGGRVRIKCPDVKEINLMFEGAEIGLKVGDKETENFNSGDFVGKSKDGKNIYVAYVGKILKGQGNFVVLVKTADSEESFANKKIGALVHRITDKYSRSSDFRKFVKRVWSRVGKYTGLVKGLCILFGGDEKEFYCYLISEINNKRDIPEGDVMILSLPNVVNWEEEEITLEKVVKEGDVLIENPVLKEYYEKAVENYNEVFELYPYEKTKNLQDYQDEFYGAIALSKAADLSGLLGLKTKQREYLEKLIESYPDSDLAVSAEGDLTRLYESTFSRDSQTIVYVNNEPHFISLLKFKEPGYDELGAELLIRDDGDYVIEAEKDDIQISPGSSKLQFKVIEIKEDSVKIKYIPDSISTVGKIVNIVWEGAVGKTIEIKRGQTEQLTPEVSVKLVKTNLQRQAKVKIIPKVYGTRTESDFHFKIGIEKRAIKLSPEKTEEMIDNLDEQIEQWEDVNEKLGNVVKGLKAACFATSAMLTIKNFFAGMSGKSMARNEVMTSAGGWNAKCRLAVDKKDVCGKGIPASVSECLLDCNDEIENSVNKLAEYYDSENERLEEIQKLPGVKREGTDILDWQGQVDNDALKKEYCEQWFKTSSIDWTEEINLREEGSQKFGDIFPSGMREECKIDLEDMKLLRMYSLTKNDEILGSIMKKKLEKEFAYTYRVNKESQNTDILQRVFWKDIPVRRSNQKTEYQIMGDISKLDSEISSKLGESTKYFSDRVGANKNVIFGLVKVGNAYKVSEVVEKKADGSIEKITTQEYTKDSNKISVPYREYYEYQGMKQFTLANPSLYKNPMQGDPKVQYHTRAPYKGLPALVPFNKKEGWYVSSDYVLSGFGKPYTEAGRAVNFWICNVGEDGLIDGRRSDRDYCRYYNLGTTQDLDFPGLDAGKSAGLVRDAERAIRQAADQYGKDKVVILNQVFETEIAEAGEAGECSDFMSPADCNLMFNVCDPVICPESRCDFGGKYRVANVVQSGIIGSLLLCLPNFPQVKIPICLSGVHAGIDSYVSILKSAQACLQESLETGRNIGICDEIKSIYLCEFFWKQAVPLMDVFIPRMFEWGLGQGVRGGGEYLTVDYAWQNMKASVDYFKNEYAVNAMKAFNARSTAEIGGEVCKMFVSARYPSGKDFFDNLIEPDSPVQFTGWFSEDILTEATIPPTSHYKVYYHIYSGKDIGAHYVVYLRGLPESAYIHTMGSFIVDRGYIERGQQVDEARDFTSVSGYKELCININGQDECGFKQVSTSWAIKELSNRYVEEQTTGEITTPEQCVAGTPSLLSFAQPNLQAGAQEYISPELYKRGIIRICSKGNPGAQVETDIEDKTKYDRWKAVGYCDESAGIECWMDTESVEYVLRDAPGLEEEILDKVDLGYLDKVEIMNPKDTENIITKAAKLWNERDIILPNLDSSQLTKENIDNEINKVITELIEITNRGIDNSYKARAFFLIGQVYGGVARRVYYEKVLGKISVRGKVVSGPDLAENVLIRGEYSVVGVGGMGGGASYTGYCNYKYENEKWTIEPDTLGCLDADVKGTYLQGIKKIAEEYDKVEVGGLEITESDDAKMEMAIINRLFSLKIGEAEDLISSVNHTIKGDKLIVKVEFKNKGSSIKEYGVFLYGEGGSLLDEEPDTYWKNVGAGESAVITVSADLGEVGSKYTIELREQNSEWKESVTKSLEERKELELEDQDKCISQAFWADKNKNKIDVSKKIKPGTIYIALKVKDIEQCNDYEIIFETNHAGEYPIEIKDYKFREIWKKYDDLYYIPHRVYDAGGLFGIADGTSKFIILDESNNVVFRGQQLIID